MKRALLYIVGFPNGRLYVGITTGTVDGRFRRHCRSDHRVGRAIRKYGPENCRLMVLHRDLTWHEAGKLERWYIQELDSMVGHAGYNQTAGGEGNLGWSPSRETRWRMGKGCRGKKQTGRRLQQTRAAADKAHRLNRGRKASPEHCARISQAKQGHPTSTVTRAKIADAVRRLWNDPAWRDRQAGGRKGSRLSDETRRKMRIAQQRRRKREVE